MANNNTTTNTSPLGSLSNPRSCPTRDHMEWVDVKVVRTGEPYFVTCDTHLGEMLYKVTKSPANKNGTSWSIV